MVYFHSVLLGAISNNAKSFRSTSRALVSPLTFIYLIILLWDFYSPFLSVFIFRSTRVMLELDKIYRSKPDLLSTYVVQ